MSKSNVNEECVNPVRRHGAWRLILLAIGWIVVIAVLIVIWMPEQATRQGQILKSAMVMMVAAGGTLAWVLLFSGWRWQARIGVLCAAVVVGGAVVAAVRIDGVSGDFLPELAWRWSDPPGASRNLHVIEQPMDRDPTTPERLADLMPGIDDYPQFLGPNRDGKVLVTLATDWKANPPREVWRREVGDGWSAFAIAGTRAVTQEQVDGEELVTCFDVISGANLWVHRTAAEYSSTVAGNGPRATPTIVGDRVYAVGSTGVMNCIDLKTGHGIWMVDIMKDNGVEPPEWGFSGSVLILGNQAIINPGGDHEHQSAIAAYDIMNGEKRWSAGKEKGTYASPVIMVLDDVSQIVMQNYNSITGHAIDNGEVLWRITWPGKYPKVANPVPLPGNRILTSSGYGVGAAVFEIKRDEDGKWTDELIWRNNRLSAKFTNVIHHDGYLYGLDDGIMVCLDATTGERLWKGGRYGHGQMILADNVLLVTTEMGDVLLIDPSPTELKELSRITVFDGVKSWNNPSLAGRYLFWRNDREAVCYELPVKGNSTTASGKSSEVE